MKIIEDEKDRLSTYFNVKHSVRTGNANAKNCRQAPRIGTEFHCMYVCGSDKISIRIGKFSHLTIFAMTKLAKRLH